LAGDSVKGTIPDMQRPDEKSWEVLPEKVCDVAHMEKTQLQKLKIDQTSLSIPHSKCVKVAYCPIPDSWKIESKDSKKCTTGGGMSVKTSVTPTGGVKGNLVAALKSEMEGGDAKIVFEMTLPMMMQKLDLAKALPDSQDLAGKSIVYEVVLGARVVGEVDLIADGSLTSAGVGVQDLNISTHINVEIGGAVKKIRGAVHRHNLTLSQVGGPRIQMPGPTTPIEDTIAFLQGKWRTFLAKSPDTWRPIFVHVSEDSKETEIMKKDDDPRAKESTLLQKEGEAAA
jgi:hypothetical protein